MKTILRNLRSFYFAQKFRFDIGMSFLGLVNFSLLAVTASDKIMPSLGISKTRYFVLALIGSAFFGMWFLGFIMDRFVKAQQQVDMLASSRSPTWQRNFDTLHRIEMAVGGSMEFKSVVSQVPTKGLRPVTFFIPCWGTEYLRLFSSSLMVSIYKDINVLINRGQRVELRIYTDNEKGIRKALEQFPGFYDLDIFPKTTIKDCFLNYVKHCIVVDSIGIMALSDFFFGQGSIVNLIDINANRHFCIAGISFRVNTDKFKPSGPMTNNELIHLALNNAIHPSIERAFINCDNNNSFEGGISIQPLTFPYYSVTHRVPNTWLACFTVHDLRFFENSPFNNYDHVWPSLLMKEERYKVIGSGDVFFAVEVATNDRNLCECDSPVGNDDYQETAQIHKKINRNFVTILTVGG